MFIKAPIELIIDKNLSSMDKCIYLAIKQYADKSGECFPSRKKIAESMDITPLTVTRSIKKLENSGYINVKRSLDSVNHYKILK
jgi:Mn-dependent DtxR family transcriptional regulator